MNINLRQVAKFLILLLLIDASYPVEPAAAQNFVICKKRSNGAVRIRSNRCVRGETKINNISMLTGADGTNGTNGADGANGSLRVYGDGSAGALTISSNTILSEVNTQFTDVVINSGVILTVRSGTVIRCTGTFTNNGTINVGTHSIGAYLHDSTTGMGTSPTFAVGGQGIASAPAGQGAFGTNAAILQGGASGINISIQTAKNVLRPGLVGGSGGGAGFSFVGGGSGGGTFTVIASGAITNNGSITADGQDISSSGAGGGGGIVILASKTSVTNAASGTISATGGDGGASTTTSGAHGGGGGGIIHLLSTTAPVNAGTLTVAGGAAGDNSTAVTASPRVAGSGGGSCGGAGGNGSNVSSSGSGNVSSGNAAGTSGYTFLTTVDPTSLM
jgi:hypothetical protein